MQPSKLALQNVASTVASVVANASTKQNFQHACPFLAQSKMSDSPINAESLPTLVTVFSETCPFLKNVNEDAAAQQNLKQSEEQFVQKLQQANTSTLGITVGFGLSLWDLSHLVHISYSPVTTATAPSATAASATACPFVQLTANATTAQQPVVSTSQVLNKIAAAMQPSSASVAAASARGVDPNEIVKGLSRPLGLSSLQILFTLSVHCTGNSFPQLQL